MASVTITLLEKNFSGDPTALTCKMRATVSVASGEILVDVPAGIYVPAEAPTTPTPENSTPLFEAGGNVFESSALLAPYASGAVRGKAWVRVQTAGAFHEYNTEIF